MQHIKDLDIKGKQVLIRCDYNVPISNGNIVDKFRVDASFDTIDYCLKNGCSIVLMSHLGRPNGRELSLSLYPIFEYLNKSYSNKVYFSKDCISEDSFTQSASLEEGEILLLENLRFYNEELQCDKGFSKKLSEHGNVYVNDAFGTSHRAHASNVGICEYFNVKAFGFLIDKEKKYLADSIQKDSSKITLILGGAKISDKIKLLTRFLDIADNILIGGAMSNNFLKAKGVSVGKSLYEEKYVEFARDILNRKNKANIVIPLDYICTQDVKNKINIRNSSYLKIQRDEYAVDIGLKTIDLFKNIIEKESKSVIWNGPMGIIEILEFSKGTKALINSIKSTKDDDFISIIGGGDTSSMIDRSEYSDFTHISTGGGASLKLLSGEVMESFEALNNE